MSQLCDAWQLATESESGGKATGKRTSALSASPFFSLYLISLISEFMQSMVAFQSHRCYNQRLRECKPMALGREVVLASTTGCMESMKLPPAPNHEVVKYAFVKLVP